MPLTPNLCSRTDNRISWISWKALLRSSTWVQWHGRRWWLRRGRCARWWWQFMLSIDDGKLTVVLGATCGGQRASEISLRRYVWPTLTWTSDARLLGKSLGESMWSIAHVAQHWCKKDSSFLDQPSWGLGRGRSVLVVPPWVAPWLLPSSLPQSQRDTVLYKVRCLEPAHSPVECPCHIINNDVVLRTSVVLRYQWGCMINSDLVMTCCKGPLSFND